MTAMEIRERLGLKPPNIFRKEQRKRMEEYLKDPRFTKAQAKELQHRQMGRTTEILVKALKCASNGKPVLLCTSNPHMRTHLRRTARQWCFQLCINPKLIVHSEPKYKHPELVVLYDHV